MGVCSAKQKDPTQPGAPVPQPKTDFETPIKPFSAQQQQQQQHEALTIHFPNNASPEETRPVAALDPSPVGSPERESDLLADLRNQPTLEAVEAEERRRQEEFARMERLREEAEQARLRAEEERRAQEEERRRQQEAADQLAREEEAERQRLAAEERERAEAAELAEARRRQEEERARAQRFVEESRAAARAEAQRRAEEEEQAREEAAKREAFQRAEAIRLEEEARLEVLRLEEEARLHAAQEVEAQRMREMEAVRAEEMRAAQEIAAERAREEAEEAERQAAENRSVEVIAERRREVKSKVENLQQRTGVTKIQGLQNHSLFFCELLWLEDFTGVKFEPELSNLKSGQVLCLAANKVQPRIAAYSESPSLWKQRENILAFLGACETLGLKKESLFLPQDLLEGQNMNNVVKTLDVFYKYVSKRDGFNGPTMLSPEDAADDNEKRLTVQTPGRVHTLKKLDFGMHADMRQKQNQKFEKEAPNIEKVSDWLKKVSGVEFKDFQEGLRSGVVLCKAMNKIQKNSIKKINVGEKPFQQRENIENFIAASKELGLKDQELFEPNDLYEGKNLLAVAECLISLSRLLKTGKVVEFRGPYITELGGGIHTRFVSFYAPGQSSNTSSLG